MRVNNQFFTPTALNVVAQVFRDSELRWAMRHRDTLTLKALNNQGRC